MNTIGEEERAYPKRVAVGVRVSFGCAAWPVMLVLLFVSSILGTTVTAEESAGEREVPNPVVCACHERIFPFAFLDRDGAPTGFSVELMEAIAREMHFAIKWTPSAAPNIESLLEAAKADIAVMLAETKIRRSVFDFSLPALRLESIVVVRAADNSVRTLDDLKGARIGVGQKGTVAEAFVRDQLPGALPLYAETKEGQLRDLAEGNIDAVVISRFAALNAIDHYGLKGLKILTSAKGYDIRYCFVVRRGDSALLARINEGLTIVQRNGVYERIHEKWLGGFERHSYKALRIISYVAGALALVSIGVLWGFLRQRNLLSRIEKQAAELSEQRSLLAALYEKHPLATVVLDIPVKEGPTKVVSINQEAVILLGHEKARSVGLKLDEIQFSPELRKYLDEIVARCRSASGPERWEVQLPDSRRLLEVATIPLGVQAGTNRVCIVTTDITKRRLMDQEIAKSRRLRALGELVGGIAHEFNNLLTPILATVSLLRSSKPPVTMTTDELNIIDQAAMRAADLTKRLLAFGRKTDDPQRTVRLSEAVANCEALLKTMIDRRIEWLNDLPPDLPPVAFNPTDFNQIVFNLVLNARDTLLEKLSRNSDPTWKPCLRVSVCKLPLGAHPARVHGGDTGIIGWQRFTVSDNGMGIPHDVVERIFEPFYTTKEVGKGTGLGLSMVWHQVTDAGGDVEVDSRQGEGSTFHVYLPCRETRPPIDASRRPERIGLEPQVHGSRLLIVEDEPLILSTAAKILERLGHKVARQSDGQSAWNEIAANYGNYDLLLLDLSLPRFSGIDLVKKLRDLPYKGAVIVMSGRVSEEDLRLLKELKVDRLLPKPFNTEQLMAGVTDVLVSKKA